MPALVGALIVAACLLAWCVSAVDEGLIGRGIFAAGSGDDFAFVAASSVRLRQQRPRGAVEVVLLASSSGREALENVRALEAGVAEGAGVPVPVHLLMAGALFHTEMLAVVDRLPSDRRWVVGVEVSERNLGLPMAEAQHLLDHPRLPLRSALQEQAATAAGLRPRVRRSTRLFLDQAPFFLARPQVLVNLARGSPSARMHQVDGMPEPTVAEWARMVKRVGGWLVRYPDNAPRNEQIYAALVTAVRARGGEVVFIEALRNPRVVEQAVTDDAAAAARQRYLAGMRRFGAEVGVEWWSVDAEARLRSVDFIDYAHLRSGDGRRRYTRALASRLGRVVANLDGAR